MIPGVSTFNRRLASALLRGPGIFGLLLLISISVPSSYGAQSAGYDALFESIADNERLQTLTERLMIGRTASGDFTQYRTLKVLKHPLISHGRFIFDSRLGLVWQQAQPFETTLILREGELIQIDSAGREQVSRADSAQGAASLAQTMPKLLSALLSGNLSQLSEHFHLYLKAGDTDEEPREESEFWQLGLIPKDPLLLKAIPKMVLEGAIQVSALTLLSNNGDRSRIEFEQISKAPLSEEQLALLSGKQGSPERPEHDDVSQPEVQPETEPERYP
ncbi:outer membrane lipoprotein carrier protein LolA [Shewanella atlantica]|uniref:outer membrane lipoprotein carrier protein LolA n=1 Tax=Shewanella atlantica TaxID=271099 RepID=UPI0037353CB9